MNNQQFMTEAHIESELISHGTCITRTRGKSMKPLFKEKRDAVVLKVPDREIRKYDVVLYKGSLGRYILHRVIAIKGGILVIRGDNTYKKELVPKENILAVMVSYNRKGKSRSIDSFGYKLYSRVWNFLYPLRYIARKPFALVKKIVKK